MQDLISLYVSRFGSEPETITQIIGSGSARTYVRLVSHAGTAIGVMGTDRRENETFVYLDREMRKHGVDMPEIYGVSADGMSYLQQDLGDTSLFALLHTPQGDAYVEDVMRKLPTLQMGVKVDESRLYPVMEMTREVAMWDLNYFKYCFAKAVGASMDEQALENDFRSLLDEVWTHGINGLVYRDCQSRNIMINGGKVWWIDFQSMRKGSVLYDVASFLWQARACFTDAERREYAEVYRQSLSEYVQVDREAFDAMLRKMALLRTLQVLGAYGLRGLIEHKAHFVLSIPGALANALALLDSELGGSYPELKRVLHEIASQDRFNRSEGTDKLHVQVFSFSYKKGYPEDLSGNGGGFMFDCRAMHNPGRYERYKPLTGRDADVIEFLEERGEVQPFLQAVEALTDPAVQRYISRGFSSLQIGFGCTGGRHRSVYCAEHLAAHIASKFGRDVIVTLTHREQNIKLKL